MECEVESRKCEVWSVECGIWSVKCGVWSVSVECRVSSVVSSVECRVGVGSGEWEVGNNVDHLYIA